jgi:hypothetical protein
MNRIILHIIFFAAGFGAGWWFGNRFIVPEISIVERSKAESKYIIQIEKTDYEALWGCHKNPISIDGVMEGNTLRVCATDDCKESRRDFILDARVKDENNNLIVGNINYTFDFYDRNRLWGGSVSYYRLFGPIGVGGGVVFNLRSIGLQAGIIAKFYLFEFIF